MLVLKLLLAGKKTRRGDILGPARLIDSRVRFTEKHQATFDEAGHILLPRFLSKSGLELTRVEIDRILNRKLDHALFRIVFCTVQKTISEKCVYFAFAAVNEEDGVCFTCCSKGIGKPKVVQMHE